MFIFDALWLKRTHSDERIHLYNQNQLSADTLATAQQLHLIYSQVVQSKHSICYSKFRIVCFFCGWNPSYL